ncbi:MAG: TraX family protein [Roseateles sp.]|uniref:TraX family protein n=1 Tax=Roseateles sp. TaxID=1971397 RepID=UPI004035EF8B
MKTQISTAAAGPRSFAVADGTLEALKWSALVLMTGDHVNKYLLGDRVHLLFILGRLVMPIFAFVLAYNLARPGVLEAGAARRTAVRLLAVGVLSTPAFLALNTLLAGWWPLNIMFMLLVAVLAIALLHRGGAIGIAGAAFVAAIGGSSVEFWWPAVLLCVGFWLYARRPGASALVLIVASCAALWVINRNHWALAALPLVLLADKVTLRVPRIRWAFYAFYPLHLSVIWLLSRSFHG